MNYFERLLRRLALDRAAPPAPATEDPFERIEEWPLDAALASQIQRSVEAPVARPVEQRVESLATEPLQPQVAIPDIPRAEVEPRDADDARSTQVAVPATIEIQRVLAEERSDGRSETRAAPAETLTPSAQAAALFADLHAQVLPSEGAVGPTTQSAPSVSTAEDAQVNEALIQSVAPQVRHLLPPTASEVAVEPAYDPVSEVSIGRIEVIVEREKPREAPRPPRVVVVQAPERHAGPASSSPLPSSQRFGIGQV